MSNVLPAGRYKCTVTSHTLRHKGPNNLLCWSAFFRGDEAKDGDDYVEMPADWGIIGDFYITKKDGSINEDQIKKLASVFDWDGDLNNLGSAAQGARCKLTVKNDTYNGKTRPKADWLDRIDAGDEGFALEWDNNVARQAQAALGAKLRALVGKPTSPANTPRPSATPARTVASGTTAPPAAPRTAMQLGLIPPNADGVWAAFEVRMKEQQVPADQVETAWFAFLQEVAGAKDTESVADWGVLIAALPSWEFLPF